MSQANFVIIITDTQGINVVGCYGKKELRTPCIDRMASNGVKYERAYTTQPVCTPARAGLFTGIYAHSSGAWGNHIALGDTMKTIGQRFQDAGYSTAYTGKWHLSGHDYFDTGICPDGWDPKYWYDAHNYMNDLTDEERSLWRHGMINYEALKKNNITPEFTWGHRVSNKGIDFIKNASQSDNPFLAVISYDEPHGPSTCPPEYVEPFLDYEYKIGLNASDALNNKPAHHREWADAANCRTSDATFKNPLYLGCNSFIDHEIGRVIDTVERYCPENTWIIFTSDHGDMMGGHGLNMKGPAMYEEITHIPLIIQKPNKKDAGTVDNALVSHIDILPTILEISGIEVPDILDGRSLYPRLKGEENSNEREILIEFNRFEIDHDFSGFQPIRCWMAGDYKLVINLLEEVDEFYNLKDDPQEMNNLINNPETRDIRDRMHDSLLDCIYEKRDPFRGPHWERRPWRKSRRLDWLGSWRPRPDDGYAPTILDYRTGRKNTGPYTLEK